MLQESAVVSGAFRKKTLPRARAAVHVRNCGRAVAAALEKTTLRGFVARPEKFGAL